MHGLKTLPYSSSIYMYMWVTASYLICSIHQTGYLSRMFDQFHRRNTVLLRGTCTASCVLPANEKKNTIASYRRIECITL